MVLTASKLRENIYRILDHVLETGETVEIERKGRRILIVAQQPPSKLERLVERPTIIGDADDLVHVDWSSEWRP